MAILERNDDSQRYRHPVFDRFVIGRSRSCDLRVEEPTVSGEHAVIRYSQRRWWIRDLGSKNGTWVDDQRLEPERAHPLAVGSCIRFGARGLWYLSSDEAPSCCAVGLDGRGELVSSPRGLLALPSDRDPAMTVYHDAALDRWLLESHEGMRVVEDREVLNVGGRRWSLRLPGEVETGSGAYRRKQWLETTVLRLRVLRGQFRVEAELSSKSGEIPLGVRSHNRILLELARQRAASLAGEGEASPSGGGVGWVDRELLCRRLGLDAAALHVQIYRLRKQWSSAGIEGAHAVIERRVSTSQLRLALAQVDVQTVPGPAEA